MKKLFPILLVLLGFLCNAQSWESLDYNPDQANLELNPLKGLTPLYNANNGFPHSIRGRILSLGEIMNGIDDFNWSVFDNFINQQGNQGRFSYLQVNVDNGKPESQVQLPAFLVNEVPHFYYVGGTNPGDNGVSQLIVDYNDPEMMAAMLNFIQRFGEKYKDDARVFLVHYGLYGVFGEWELGYGAIDVPAGENWEMTPENQLLITNAYSTAFGDKNLLARFPENVPEPQSVGYSDGLYFGASISDESNFQWFFLPKLEQSNADLNWKNHPIGGEVDPAVQPILWLEFPNENLVGQFGQIQNTEEVFNLTHPTFLFQDHVFNGITETGDPVEWANALKATKKTGYTFHVSEYRLSAANSNPAIEVNIQNKGIAPMYANWEVEFGYLDTNGDVISIGTSSTWNLKTIQPDVTDNYRSFISTATVPDGTHTFVLKVINPLEALIPNPANAHPVRFANPTQDMDLDGWLTLGDLTIAGGNAGDVPIPVESIAITPTTSVMAFESQLQLTATVLPVDATNPAVTWVSNRPSTVSVDENGLATSNTLGGDVMITGYTEDGALSSIANITVELASFQIPGLVQAEFFSASNNLQINSAPESEEVDGEVLGFIGDDTWMEYMVDATQAGEYIVDFRASSFSGDGVINILNDAGTILGSVAFTPETGNYDIYKTYTSGVINLPAGEQILRLDVVASSFNLNWIEFKLNPCPGEDPSIIGTICDDGDPNTLNDRYSSTCVCVGVPANEFVVIPSLIEAEDFYQFADGGEQINSVPAGETGGSAVGFINDDTWLEYAVTVEEDSDFILDFRASNPFGQAEINILNETGDVLATVDFMPDTGGSYDTYDIFSSNPFTLPVGNHVIRLDVVKSAFNLNWIEFRLGPCAGFDLSLINTPCDDGDANTENDRYTETCDCVGIPVDEFIDIPALIEAEDFYDVFNIQLEGTPAGETGGEVLGFIADNTWMDYAVKVSEEAIFIIDARASSFSGDGFINILNETFDTLGTIALTPSTGSYNIFSNYISSAFTLPVGYHKIRLDVEASAFNLNWVDFRLESSVALNKIEDRDFVKIYPNPVTDLLYIDIVGANESVSEIRVYDLWGRLLLNEQTSVGSLEINVAPLNATKMIFVQIINDGQQTTRKILLK